MTRGRARKGAQADPESERRRAIERLRRRLDLESHPRLIMLLVIALAGLAGFLVSVGLLRVGLGAMAIRYALAALAAYLAFLFGLRVWLALQGRRTDPDVDLLDAGGLVGGGRGEVLAPPFRFGGGGGFSGGGAGSSFSSAGAVSPPPPTPIVLGSTSGSSEAGSGLADVLSDVGDGDGAGAAIAVVVLVGALLVAGVIAIVAAVGGAPTLFAELLLDGVIAGEAYRRLRGVETRHWLESAVARTWKPMLAIVVLLAVAGGVAQHLVPGADSIGDFFRR